MDEEIEYVREGKHGAWSPQQVIAIGLSKARRSRLASRSDFAPADVPLGADRSRECSYRV
ncbi:MAG: hypothetical protein DMG30_27675 [Acidobacteria bacterium]|nr:MAG: hypothetical protein DMG30_27675 [Acidobacteriota bacterium]